LAEIGRELELDAETEHEVLEELRGHLEDSYSAAIARGANGAEALSEATARFGVEEAVRELRATHAGQGTLDGIMAAALPVICALVLRWLIFAPDGTYVGWEVLLTRPAFWVVALAALLVPLLRFPRRRHALAMWAVFWGLSVTFVLWPTLRW
jgi:hypothetical protein